MTRANCRSLAAFFAPTFSALTGSPSAKVELQATCGIIGNTAASKYSDPTAGNCGPLSYTGVATIIITSCKIAETRLGLTMISSGTGFDSAFFRSPARRLSRTLRSSFEDITAILHGGRIWK